MTFIVNGLAFLSGAAIFVGVLIFISVTIDKLIEAKRKRIEDEVNRAHKDEWKHYLRESAYWFSEDVPTFHLITGLVEQTNVDTLREIWRRERAKLASEAAVMHTVIEGARQPAAPGPSAGEWSYDKPHFVDSEGCMGHHESYWRVWGERGAEIHAGFGTSSEQALVDCVKKCEGQPPKTSPTWRTQSQVLDLRNSAVRCCIKCYFNEDCDCLEVARDDAAEVALGTE